jgi:predicted ATPase
MNPEFPFIGREKPMAWLRQFYKKRSHVLILGPEGIGKSALVEQVRRTLGLWVCPHSEHLGEICKSLEGQLGLEADGLLIVKRKNRILKLLGERKNVTIVFDGATWTTPKLGTFIECVCSCVPVWLCARSEHPWDIGRIWPLLVRFQHIELKPFHPKESKSLVAAAIGKGQISEKTSGIVDWLHRRAEGNPKILCELLTEIAHGCYDFNNPHSLQLLDLDRRIHEIFPTSPNQQPQI